MADVERANLRASLRADQALLCSMQDELSAVTQTRTERLRLLQDAQAAFDLVVLQHRFLAARYDAMRSDICQRQAALGTFNSFPNELLSEIFEYTLPPFAIDHGDCAAFSRERILMPSTLACVSKRWRDVVAGTAELHSYLGVSYDIWRTQTYDFFAYVERTVRRARRLDVVLRVENRPSSVQDSESTRSVYDGFWSRVFDHVYANANRLRTLVVRSYAGDRGLGGFPEGARDLTMGLLRLPTPNLEEVAITFYDDTRAEDWGAFRRAPAPVYLPFAPKLRSLQLVYTR